MLDRFIKLIVVLTLLLFLFQAVIGVLAQSLEALLRGARSMMGSVGGFVGALVILTFIVGLLVRGAQFISTRDSRAARERATRDRTVRQRVRRPSEGVPPVESRMKIFEDPDPAIGEERD